MTVWLVADLSLEGDWVDAANVYSNFEDAMENAYKWAQDNDWNGIALNRIHRNWYYLSDTESYEDDGKTVDIIKKLVLNHDTRSE